MSDEVVDFPTLFVETKPKEIERLEESLKKNGRYSQPGFLDQNLIMRGDVKKNSNFRFAQVKSHKMKQDDDFYNPQVGSNDINKPVKELEIIRKEGLSNGIVTYDRKRICNFETGDFPEYYEDLRKD